MWILSSVPEPNLQSALTSVPVTFDAGGGSGDGDGDQEWGNEKESGGKRRMKRKKKKMGSVIQDPGMKPFSFLNEDRS